jgi:hypothetical protein
MPRCKHLPIDSGATPIGSAGRAPDRKITSRIINIMIYDIDLIYFRINGLALYFFDFRDDYDWSLYASLRLP